MKASTAEAPQMTFGFASPPTQRQKVGEPLSDTAEVCSWCRFRGLPYGVAVLPGASHSSRLCHGCTVFFVNQRRAQGFRVQDCYAWVPTQPIGEAA